MENLLEKIGELADAWVKIDERIGFSRIIKYIVLIFVILIIINFKTVTKEAIVFVQEISEQIHNEKMTKRDKLMTELTPVLQDYRMEVRADRLLYFEYHNSKENLVGIPFKYIDLVQQSTGYGIPTAPVDNYRDINVGTITNLYNDLKGNKAIICSGEDDIEFLHKYPGTYEMFNAMDGSRRFIFISIPGVKQPVGMIVLEWIVGTERTPEEMKQILDSNTYYISIINGLILANR